MRNLVFIRHSQSQPEAGVPARLWQLTAEGRRHCVPLAKCLIPYRLDLIVSSTEPKAIETGKLVAQRLGIRCQVAENLHEHARETAPYFDTPAEFRATIAKLFARPAERVFGEETGLEARDRFSGAVESVMDTHPHKNIAIVTHGTVLSLFACQFTKLEITAFWRGLGMPAIVAFSYPQMKLLAQVNQIEDEASK